MGPLENKILHEGNKIFGYRSLLFRGSIYIIAITIGAVIDVGILVVPAIIFVTIALFGWEIIFLKRVQLHNDQLNVRNIFGIGKNKTFTWDDIGAVSVEYINLNTQYWYYKLYIYKNDNSLSKVNLLGMYWFERNMLMKELENYTTVKKDPPLPKFWDLM